MDIRPHKRYRAQRTQATAAVTDNTDQYVLLFALSGALVAFIVVMMGFAN
jgi:hypothetical protein